MLNKSKLNFLTALSVAFSFAPLMAHADWPATITCTAQKDNQTTTIVISDLPSPSQVNANGITPGGKMTVNGQGDGAMTMIMKLDDSALNIMVMPPGIACELAQKDGKISGACGLPASGEPTAVTCK